MTLLWLMPGSVCLAPSGLEAGKQGSRKPRLGEAMGETSISAAYHIGSAPAWLVSAG